MYASRSCDRWDDGNNSNRIIYTVQQLKVMLGVCNVPVWKWVPKRLRCCCCCCCSEEVLDVPQMVQFRSDVTWLVLHPQASHVHRCANWWFTSSSSSLLSSSSISASTSSSLWSIMVCDLSSIVILCVHFIRDIVYVDFVPVCTVAKNCKNWCL